MLFFELFSGLLRDFLFFAGFVSGSNSFPPPLSPEEEAVYLEKLQAGDKTARNILIERNLRLVAHIIKKYSDENNGDDLISIGTIGLIKGVDTFRFDKNKKLSAYISRCIENEVLMYLRSNKKRQSDVSIDESIGTDKDGNAMSFSDILPADIKDFAEDLWLRQEQLKMYRAMKQILSPAEIELLCLRYGLGGHKRVTQREIAAKMGISRSYVSRLEKKCIKKLHDALCHETDDDDTFT